MTAHHSSLSLKEILGFMSVNNFDEGKLEAEIWPFSWRTSHLLQKSTLLNYQY